MTPVCLPSIDSSGNHCLVCGYLPRYRTWFANMIYLVFKQVAYCTPTPVNKLGLVTEDLKAIYYLYLAVHS